MPRRPSGNKYSKLVRVVTSGEEVISIGRMAQGEFSFSYTPFSFYKEQVIIYNFKKLLPANNSLVLWLSIMFIP